MGEGSILAPKREVVDYDQPEVVGGLASLRARLLMSGTAGAVPSAPAVVFDPCIFRGCLVVVTGSGHTCLCFVLDIV